MKRVSHTIILLTLIVMDRVFYVLTVTFDLITFNPLTYFCIAYFYSVESVYVLNSKPIASAILVIDSSPQIINVAP